MEETKADMSVSKAEDDLKGLRIDSDSATTAVPSKDLPTTPPAPDPPKASEKPAPRRLDSEYNEKDPEYTQEPNFEEERAVTNTDNDSASEIQSIMEQFTNEAHAPTKEEIMSPRHEMPNPLGFPPRKSSLEHTRSWETDQNAVSPIASMSEALSSPPPVPPKPDASMKGSQLYGVNSGSTTSLPHQPPPPEPEPDRPFDFHRFLEQLRHKSADPVAKFLRSFLTEFGKKQWMVHEQVKIIQDFLTFIANKMALCDVWREVSDVEFDNAKEGMEKLVMNRLYSQTFSPAIPPLPQPPRGRGSKRKDMEKVLGPGRRGQHQEDIERDDILAQKIRIYTWVREEHLDIPPVGSSGERFLRLAQQELLKIKSYRAPRDKIICVLNCCKVIFGLLKNAKSSDTSADSFIPLLIYVVLQANPEHLVSNIQYILRFRNQDKLGGEAGYYLSSLSGAIQFIEGLDRTTLTVSDEDFEKNVELAVSAIAEQNRQNDALSPRAQTFSEKSALSEAEVTPRNSMDVTSTSPKKGSRMQPSTSATDSGSEASAAAGLLRTIQRPLSTIGRIFSDTDTNHDTRNRSPGTGTNPSSSPAMFKPGDGSERPRPTHVASYDPQEAAARQASAEAAEARRIQRAEHRNIIETLCGMFPNLDKDVIDDVVRQKQGRVGLAVDACLSLTAGG